MKTILKAKDLCNIDEYVYIETASEGYDYYVALTSSGANGKIVVAVSGTGLDLPLPTSVTEVSNEEQGPRVVYVE